MPSPPGSGHAEPLDTLRIDVFSLFPGLVDAFCAMVTDRAYRGAHTREDAVRHVADSAGTLWDPDVAAAFGRLLERDEQEIFRDLDELVAGSSGRQ